LIAIAEAPSKAIVTGEHFVVHGAWALAAALPRAVQVSVEDAPRFKVSSEAFPSPRDPALAPVAELVEAMAREYSFSPKVRVKVRSSVPGGAGLGSSASTMVALASALSRLRALDLGRDEIVKAAMVGEASIHGRPSGIDPTICTRGGVLLYRPGSKPRPVHLGGARSLLISYSGVSRSTKAQIGHVSDVKGAHPDFFSSLADSASAVSELAARMLAEGDLRGLGGLLSLNHAMLSAIGISSRRLDELVAASLSLGSYGAKLTGAGGGGSVLSVAPEGKQKSIISGLNARGFETFRAKVPVKGVRSWLRL
jgi:mevalonate kinase